MRAKFNQSFKIQSVQKALYRRSDVTLKDFATSLGVGYLTLTLTMHDDLLRQPCRILQVGLAFDLPNLFCVKCNVHEYDASFKYLVVQLLYIGFATPCRDLDNIGVLI